MWRTIFSIYSFTFEVRLLHYRKLIFAPAFSCISCLHKIYKKWKNKRSNTLENDKRQQALCSYILPICIVISNFHLFNKNSIYLGKDVHVNNISNMQTKTREGFKFILMGYIRDDQAVYIMSNRIYSDCIKTFCGSPLTPLNIWIHVVLVKTSQLNVSFYMHCP